MTSTVSQRLELLNVTEENFLRMAKWWRALRAGREKLKFHAKMYPVMIDLEKENIRFALVKAEDVDTLIAGVRAKLKKLWLE